MSELLPMGSVRATVQRHITDEETVCFEGHYGSEAEARTAVTAQLALCRDHMARYNTEVRLVDEAKSQELTETLAAKGEEIKRLDGEIAAKQAELAKLGKRLRSA